MTDCQLETSSSNENGGLEKDLAVAEDSSLIIDSSIVYGGEILDHEDISYCVKVASVETTCSTSDGQQCEPDVILSDQVLFCEDPEQVDLIEAKPTDEEADDDVIMQHMDIQEPLTTLRKLLEIQMRCSLEEYEFWLQDTIKLDPSQNLVSQCVQGSGTVQINLEVKSYPNMAPRFNIVDVLKPADEDDESLDLQVPAVPRSLNVKFACQSIEPKETVSRWIIDHAFRREQEKLGIPLDPAMWNYEHVRHWIHWAVKKFSLRGVDVANFTLTGQELIALTHEQFVKYIPCDYNDVFWTHLELLRKCKFIAVQHAPSGTNKLYMRKVKATSVPSSAMPINCKTAGTASSGSGQVQLWQFLLDLLTDASYRPVIQWIGDEGEFKLNDPELVAQLWGQRKGKPAMNYEKLSRALRYYYDGDMIAKVHGKRFVYKFVCDLRSLLGYSAAELNQLTLEALGQLQRTDHVINGGVLLQSNELYSI